MKRKSETISFRVEPKIAKLVDHAREPFGLSRGEWIRGQIIGHLQTPETDEVANELTRIRGELSELQYEYQALQSGIRRLAFVIMTQGEPLSGEAAKAVMQKLFRPNANPRRQEETS